MRSALLSLALILTLVACNPTPQNKLQRDSDPVVTQDCNSCTYNAELAAQSIPPGGGSTPLTPAFTVSAVQAYNTNNPVTGVTWSYGSASITATASSTSGTATLDSFGFIDQLTTQGTTYKMNYNLEGFTQSVDKVVNGVSVPYLEFAYDGDVPVSYYNHEDDQTYYLNPPQQNQFKSISNPTGVPNYSQLMSPVQSMSACEGCYATFEVNMQAARNTAAICMSAATAGFIACAIFAPAIPACFAAWAIANAVCLANFKNTENQLNQQLEICLQVNNCANTTPPGPIAIRAVPVEVPVDELD